MEELFTGFVRAAGYANKVRKTLFAIVKKRAEANEVVRAAAELNQHIFNKLQEMNVEKSDVITIRVNFEIAEGKISWKLDTLQIEVFRKSEEERLAEAMREREEAEKEIENVIDELIVSIRNVEDAVIKLKELAERLKYEHGRIEGE